MIPRSVRMSESPSHGLSVLEYESKSAGAEGYRALAAEIIERQCSGMRSEGNLIRTRNPLGSSRESTLHSVSEKDSED